jgi:hypothetical protein
VTFGRQIINRALKINSFSEIKNKAFLGHNWPLNERHLC